MKRRAIEDAIRMARKLARESARLEAILRAKPGKRPMKPLQEAQANLNPGAIVQRWKHDFESFQEDPAAQIFLLRTCIPLMMKKLQAQEMSPEVLARFLNPVLESFHQLQSSRPQQFRRLVGYTIVRVEHD